MNKPLSRLHYRQKLSSRSVTRGGIILARTVLRYGDDENGINEELVRSHGSVIVLLLYVVCLPPSTGSLVPAVIVDISVFIAFN